MSDTGTPKKSREPKYSRFTQQALPSFRPVLEPVWVIFIFFAITIILIPIGAVCLHYGLKAHEQVYRYDHVCYDESSNSTSWNSKSNSERSSILKSGLQNLSCVVNITISKKMDSPIFVYYELDGFYQNHRRYVRSRDDAQLANKTGGSLSSCSPQDYFPGTRDVIVPCGLIAWSYFNDSYSFNLSSNGSLISNLTVKDTGIAVKSDRQNRFSSKATFSNFNPDPKNVENNSEYIRGGGTADGSLSSQERLIIWMRTAALPKFRKLWGKLEYDLEEGSTISIKIKNNYNTYSFDGKKSIVLGTTTWLGGRNPFLGIAYIVTGGVSFAMGLVYTVLWQLKGRKTFGNPQDLSTTWNRPLGCL